MARLQGISINLSAFLDMIAHSEGTPQVACSDDGYNVVVGGTLFHDYSHHPHIMIDLPKLGIKSSAAGRYQVLGKYADTYIKSLGLPDFGPESQDKIAIQQIKEQHALSMIENGNIASAIAACSNIWASLPGNSYGQNQNSAEALISFYNSAKVTTV